MLFYSVLQSLGGASYVARITLARKFIYNRTFLCGRNAVLLNGRKTTSSFNLNIATHSLELLSF